MSRSRAVLIACAGAFAALAARAQTARIYFIDVGQGTSTLIVSPAGGTLLVDGGPNGAGSGKIVPLLNSLGITALNHTVVTHYHIDHDAGMAEVIGAGKLAGGVAWDNGDGADVQPPNPAGTTYAAYATYLAAIGPGGASRQTIQPGQVIDLGGGMKATCLVARGRFLSGAVIPVTPDDLNTQSISLLVQYGTFSFLVSGDLTGGGATRAARTLDLETYAAQLAGDVDVVSADHHGSLTSSNRRYLRALKAEVLVASIGEGNGFGHPAKEIANRFLHTPATDGNVYPGTGVPAGGVGPVFYQTEASPPAGSVTAQGWSGAASGAGGSGTILLTTEGTTTYALRSFDDGGLRINPALHTYLSDGSGSGVTTNFPPTVIPSVIPVVPTSFGGATVSARVDDREDAVGSVTLDYALDGTPQAPVAMTLAGGLYQAAIPVQPNGTRVDLTITALAGGATTVARAGYFAGITPIAALQPRDAEGEPLAFDYAARVRATVTAGTGVFSAGPDRFEALEDATGGLILFYAATTPFGGPSATCPGQLVDATGRVAVSEGQLELDLSPDPATVGAPYFVSPVSTGADPAPLTLTLAQLAAAPESYEGRLVRVAGVTIGSGTIPAAPASFDAYLAITDATGSFSMKIFAESDLPGLATPAAPFDLTGVVTQDDGLRPFTGGYAVAPRHRADLGAPPLLPSFVNALAGTANVTVTWENSLQSGSYRIERAGSCAGPWSAVTTRTRTSGATNFYTDTSVTPGAPACYRIVPLTDACGGGAATACNGSAACALPVAGTSAACAPEVVISQVYGGGNNSGATWQNDFIELHNRSTGAVSLAGWAVQYASGGGTGNWTVTPLAGTIPAGGYYLVQESGGTANGAPLPAPDATGTIAMSATGGKVALTSSATVLNGACPASAAIVDKLGYSLTANCSETAPIGSLSATAAGQRKSGGCTDRDNNSADFTIATPAPRNASTPALTCNCSTPPPIEVSSVAGGIPLKVTKNGDGSLNLDFEELPDAAGYNLYAGDLANFYSHGGAPADQCATPTTTPAFGLRRTVYPAAGPAGYFLIAAYNAIGEGSAGFASAGVEIPPAQSSCAP